MSSRFHFVDSDKFCLHFFDCHSLVYFVVDSFEIFFGSSEYKDVSSQYVVLLMYVILFAYPPTTNFSVALPFRSCSSINNSILICSDCYLQPRDSMMRILVFQCFSFIILASFFKYHLIVVISRFFYVSVNQRHSFSHFEI